jgi:hypothetical protein
MNKLKLLLLLTSSAIVTGTPLVGTNVAGAAEGSFTKPDGSFCVSAHQKLVCVKASQLTASREIDPQLLAKSQAIGSDPDGFINFSDEESDAAAQLFGCDCPACIRSLRQLRTLGPVS